MIAKCCVFPETPRSDCLCNCCWSNRLCIVIVDLSEHALRILQLTILDNTPNLEHIFVWERRFTEALIAWHHALYHHLRWSVFPSNTNRRRTVIHIHLDIDTSLTYAGTIIPFLWEAEVLTHRSMVSFIRRVSRNFNWTSVPTDPLRNTATCVEKECLSIAV